MPYSVSDDEADAVAGTHANNNGCAVLSKDSDFYVFNVHQGCIHEWGAGERGEGGEAGV